MSVVAISLNKKFKIFLNMQVYFLALSFHKHKYVITKNGLLNRIDDPFIYKKILGQNKSKEFKIKFKLTLTNVILKETQKDNAAVKIS